jgi:uncharacterized protein
LVGKEIQNVQVTLDGDRLLHDENRIPVSGQPTFDTTIAAVRQLIGLQARVSLRIHIHHGRLDSARNLVEYLEKEKILGHPQVDVYFSPINTFDSDQNSPAEADMFRDVPGGGLQTNRPPQTSIS